MLSPQVSHFMFQFLLLSVFALFPAFIWNLVVRRPALATLLSFVTSFGVYVFFTWYFWPVRDEIGMKFSAALFSSCLMGVLFWSARRLWVHGQARGSSQ